MKVAEEIPNPHHLKIVDELSVNPKVLASTRFDSIKAIHRLFQVLRQYDGHLFEYQDSNDTVAASLGTLSLICS